MKTFFKNYWKKILELFLVALSIPWIWMNFSTLSKISHTENSPENFANIVIVFGAAVYGKESVSDVFADRLGVAAELYSDGSVQKILVSGDNRFENYNEPEAGKKFLISLGIPQENIVLDYAGRRTYDTCWRAKNIFGVNKAYLSTQRFHLPRAIFLCEQMGIESVGVSASLQIYQGKYFNIFRESLAQQKAFYEKIFFNHQAEITGEREFIFTP